MTLSTARGALPAKSSAIRKSASVNRRLICPMIARDKTIGVMTLVSADNIIRNS
jgi:hypothetical protein